MVEKRDLYLESGAKEVWLCLDGTMSFYDATGQLGHSNLIPDFPSFLSIDN